MRIRTTPTALFLLAIMGAAVPDASAMWVGGTVKSASGVPIANVDVDAVDVATGATYNLPGVVTGSTGEYEFFLNPGTYDLRFDPPVGAPYMGKELESVVVMATVIRHVTLASGVAITGVVRGPGAVPVTDVDIDVLPAGSSSKIYISHDTTAANGSFSIVVAPGAYDLLFEPGVTTSLVPSKDLGIVVAASPVSHDKSLAAGVTLSGNVEDPSGNPVARANVDLINATTLVSVPLVGDDADALGNFTVVVAPGIYNMRVREPGSLGYDVYEKLALNIATATIQNANMTFGLRAEGLVRGNGNLPVEGVKIDVFDSATGQKIPQSDPLTDSGGNYRVDIPAGTLDFVFLAPPGSGRASFRQNGVVVADDLTIDLTLPTGVTVSGTVTNNVGAPVANADFDFENPLTGADIPTWNDNTDALGNYSVIIPSGNYDITVDAGAAVPLVAQFHANQSLTTTQVRNFQLQPGALLFGHVSDLANNSWANVDIDVVHPVTLAQVKTPRDDTNANGDYVVVVPLGNWNVTFTPAIGFPVLPATTLNLAVSGNLLHNKILTGTTTGIEEVVTPSPGAAIQLLPAYPNPFRASTRIAFAVPTGGPARLAVFDIAGRRVRTLLEGPVEPGRTEADWDGRDSGGRTVGAGIYFVELTHPSGTASRKVVLTK